jgi:hypothetical protein
MLFGVRLLCVQEGVCVCSSMVRKTDMAEEEIALLRAKLEASELRHEVKELRSVVAQYQRELKESNTLLLKQRLPPRPHTNSTQRPRPSFLMMERFQAPVDKMDVLRTRDRRDGGGAGCL